MDFDKELKDIRTELSEAKKLYLCGNISLARACLFHAHNLIRGLLRHLAERSQDNGQKDSRENRQATGESQA